MTAKLSLELQRWARSIACSIARRLPPSIEADDLVQVAMLATWQAQGTFDRKRGVPFPAYAYPRVRGAVLMSIRGRAWREATHEELPEVETGGASPEYDACILTSELVQRVELAIAPLPRRVRRAARAVWLHGQGTLDLAGEMGCSRSTIYALLGVARAAVEDGHFLRERAIEEPEPQAREVYIGDWVSTWLEAQSEQLGELMQELTA